jgi:hypothetical protein
MKTQVQTKKTEGGVGTRAHLPISNYASPDSSPHFSTDADQEDTALHPNGYNLASVSIAAKSSVNNQQNTPHGATGRLPIQAKLTIGQPNDKYEQEADRLAAKVVKQIHAPQTKQPDQCESIQKSQMGSPDYEEKLTRKPTVQQLSNEGRTATTPTLESSIAQAKSGGEKLPENVRKPMEKAFYIDFSDVRIHTNAKSNYLNQVIRSRAFTSKNDIFFRYGNYNPSSRKGQELIAHELTHVVQQNNKGAMPMIQCNYIDTLKKESGVPALEKEKLSLEQEIKFQNAHYNLKIKDLKERIINPYFSNRKGPLEEQLEELKKSKQDYEKAKSVALKELEIKIGNAKAKDDLYSQTAQKTYNKARNINSGGKKKLYLGSRQEVSSYADKKLKRKDRKLDQSVWSWGINEAWLEGGISGGSRFKLKTDIGDEVAGGLRANPRMTANDFYNLIRPTVVGGEGTNRTMWHSLDHRPTWYAQEIMKLLETGYTFEELPRKHKWKGEFKRQLIPPR